MERGLAWLKRQIGPSGAVTLPGDPDHPHWSTSLALFAASRLGETGATWRESARFLLNWQSVVTEPDPAIPLNSELEGWPWYPDSFSWVIPTAHALLALRLTGNGSHSRVSEGVALLLDRACVAGGWNYGNREVLGQTLDPMAETTAWALLALQGEPPAQDATELGLGVLTRELRTHASSLSLAMALLCFQLYGYPMGDLPTHLLERQMDDGSWQHQVHVTALAVLSLKAVLGAGNAFAL